MGKGGHILANANFVIVNWFKQYLLDIYPFMKITHYDIQDLATRKESYIKPSPETNDNFRLQKSRHCGVYDTYLNLLWVKRKKNSKRMRGGRGVVVW